VNKDSTAGSRSGHRNGG